MLSNITAETLQAAIETRMAEPLAVLADQTRQRGTLILTSDAANNNAVWFTNGFDTMFPARKSCFG